MKYAILTHGGAGSPKAHADGCVASAERARQLLEAGSDAFTAALAATTVLEDDPRFNAGTGSNVRFDGQTIEMDAAVMTSEGRFGAVACIQGVKNPILVASRVMETPHLMLGGEGATAFARRLGFPEYDPLTEASRQRHTTFLTELTSPPEKQVSFERESWGKIKASTYWNFSSAPPPSDTVGCVIRDTHGRFAATASTGGTTYMLKGRIGDCPLMGCGVYAGPQGAVATTGVGEEIIRRFLAKTVYDWMAEGAAPARAAQRGLAMFPDVVAVGILVIGRTGQAIATNRSMASAQLLG